MAVGEGYVVLHSHTILRKGMGSKHGRDLLFAMFSNMEVLSLTSLIANSWPAVIMAHPDRLLPFPLDLHRIALPDLYNLKQFLARLLVKNR